MQFNSKDLLSDYEDNLKPKIGFDCISLPQNFSGAAYYIYSLARNLLMSDRPFSIVIFCRKLHISLFRNLLKEGDSVRVIPANSRLKKLYFYEFELKRYLLKDNIRLFHSTHYICPPEDQSYFLVNTFHDMGFFRFPSFYSLIKRVYFKNRMNIFTNRSDLILAVSDSTSKDIKNIFPENSRKVKTIYPGIDHLNDIDIVLRQEPFIFSVNTMEKRKNIPFIIKMFNCLKAKYHIEHKLILLGQRSNDYKNVLREYYKSEFRKDIIIKEHLSEENLVVLYKTAECFISSSEYEGFGFTPLEALRFSCPAFLYKNNVTDELFTGYPYIIDNLDPEYWAEIIYSEMVNNFKNFIIPVNLNCFNWKLAAEYVSDEYEKLLKQAESVYA
jgi:glycosyltransferase involved in cell wall biosynthesis